MHFGVIDSNRLQLFNAFQNIKPREVLYILQLTLNVHHAASRRSFWAGNSCAQGLVNIIGTLWHGRTEDQTEFHGTQITQNCSRLETNNGLLQDLGNGCHDSSLGVQFIRYVVSWSRQSKTKFSSSLRQQCLWRLCSVHTHASDTACQNASCPTLMCWKEKRHLGLGWVQNIFVVDSKLRWNMSSLKEQMDWIFQYFDTSGFAVAGIVQDFYRQLQGQEGNVTSILAAHSVTSFPSSSFGSLLPKEGSSSLKRKGTKRD